MSDLTSEILVVIELAEKLKQELRHSWLSSGRQESVAEHCWRLTLCVALLSKELKEPINLEKALLMALVHDLPEIKVGDHPDFSTLSKEDIEAKFQSEKKAMQNICDSIQRPDLFELWLEFELGSSNEAKLVRALDRIEGQIQHNQAELKTWLDVEKKRQYLGYEYLCEHDAPLKSFAALSVEKSQQKLDVDDHHQISQWMEGKSVPECRKEVGLKQGPNLNDALQSETANP